MQIGGSPRISPVPQRDLSPHTNYLVQARKEDQPAYLLTKDNFMKLKRSFGEIPKEYAAKPQITNQTARNYLEDHKITPLKALTTRNAAARLHHSVDRSKTTAVIE